MKADEPDTDILETLRKLVKRVEILEIDNRQLKKENEQLRQENTQLRQENTRLKKRIEELERKNKRYVAPHSRELAKEDPKPSGRRAGADRPPWGAALSKTRELSVTNKALKMKTSRLLSQWISPIFAPPQMPDPLTARVLQDGQSIHHRVTQNQTPNHPIQRTRGLLS